MGSCPQNFMVIIGEKYGGPEVKLAELRLLGISCIECCRFSNSSADIGVTIFRVNICGWEKPRKLLYGYDSGR
jgi:hypothetical protein